MTDIAALERVRTRPTRRELRTDALVAVGIGLASACMAALTIGAEPISGFSTTEWPAILASFAFNLPLAFRRLWPATIAVVVCVLYGVLASMGFIELTSAQVTLFLGFYSIGAWDANRRRAFVVRLVIVIGMALWLLTTYTIGFFVSPPGDQFGTSAIFSLIGLQVLINIAYFTGAWMFGERAWTQAVERQELERAHAEIQLQQEQLTEQAVGLERVRIARELHDVVAHHVSAMGIQAGAARRVMGRDDDRARDSLKAVEQSARDAITELRTMVVALRSDDETNEPMPGIEDIEALVETARESGQTIDARVVGDAVPVSPVVALTAYRVLQEALTNARKHAGPVATVTARLRYLPAAIEIEVTDDGHGTTQGHGTGMGLVGMRERIAAVGGEVDAGRRPGGGWQVRARLPVTSQAPGATASDLAPSPAAPAHRPTTPTEATP